MKGKIFRMRFITVTIFTVGLLSAKVYAALTVSNWNLTITSLTFDLNGTLDQEYPGSRLDQLDVFIGQLYNSNWINSELLTGSIVDHGSTVAGSELNAYAWSGSPDGDLTYLRYSPRWQTGYSFNYSVSFNGDFNPAGVEPGNMGVFWGLNDRRWLQPELQVGTVIPEPTVTLFLCSGTVGLAMIRRRRRQAEKKACFGSTP